MAKDPTDLAVRNLVLMQRLGNTLSLEARKVIAELFDDIVSILVRVDPISPAAERFRRMRVQKVLDQVKLRNREAFDAVHKMMRGDLGAIGASQAQWAKESLLATLGTEAGDILVVAEGLTAPYFRKILDTNPFQGDTLRGWFRDLETRTLTRVSRQVQIGMAQNETIDQMVRRVRGRSTGGGRYTGGVLSTTTRDAETIVRTAVNEIANTAHLDVWKANQDITTGYEYVATLDSRTTVICASLDGRTWKWDDPNGLRPPQHPNCRSTTVPVVDWAGLGMEPPATGTRASAGGQVSADLTYEQWLKKQPASTVAEVLGKGRAKLFMDGKLSLKDAVRSDGTLIPLERLRDGT